MNDEMLSKLVEHQTEYNVPECCSKCSGTLKYEGVGEYICVTCGNKEYDDYGKVRGYLEKHPGSTQATVSSETGVSKAVIRQMIIDGRIKANI